ncbi:ribokinase [Leptolyngbya sp. 'hensonii']|uniref:ribokinase n=1 Tax=Leptolyngbya sp. 'hensonii' TaxID=1922337 RepID=UPI00094FD5BA|nr:ribokinase [Leptolyngbya sp. 'hensonii']OLP15634.1 ribokinase [Leptolyngbya sp. 'hensonii']
MTILVFGSINMDLVARTPRLPVTGETILGHSFHTSPGGKGANQAVAAARLGAPVTMVGRVGADGFGQELLSSLQTAGVQTKAVLVDGSDHSGVALIAVDDRGENQIIVTPGVNRRVSRQDVDRLIPLLPGTTNLLLQFEVPLPAVRAAAQAARAAGVRVILDPAPCRPDIPDDLYPLVDIITPNEIEAEQLVGFPITCPEAWTEAAATLLRRGVGIAIIKLGVRGVFCASVQEVFFAPAFPVQAVDTVAAGDAFNGGLAVALAEGLSLKQAVMWGAAAGALSTTKAGAQVAMPDRPTLDGFLRNQSILV